MKTGILIGALVAAGCSGAAASVDVPPSGALTTGSIVGSWGVNKGSWSEVLKFDAAGSYTLFVIQPQADGTTEAAEITGSYIQGAGVTMTPTAASCPASVIAAMLPSHSIPTVIATGSQLTVSDPNVSPPSETFLAVSPPSPTVVGCFDPGPFVAAPVSPL